MAVCARVLGDGTPVVSVRAYDDAQEPGETTVFGDVRATLQALHVLACALCTCDRLCYSTIAQAIESCIQCTSFVFHMTTLHMQVDRWTSVRDPVSQGALHGPGQRGACTNGRVVQTILFISFFT